MRVLLKPTCFLFCLLMTFNISASGEDRKVKTKVAQAYHEVMRRMNMGGTVKLSVVVGADGRVMDAKAIGGHPMLIAPATDAVKQWKFEPAGEQTVTIVEMKFDPAAQ